VKLQYAIVLFIGLVIGAALAVLINHLIRRDAEKSFSALSKTALQSNSTTFLELANQTLATQTRTGAMELEGRKKLIDQSLDGIKGELQRVEVMVQNYEKDRALKFGDITGQIAALQQSTSKLQIVLSGTKTRGQWGERMTDDILRLAGFVEGINYKKQQVIETAGSRPDYTFFLPRDLKLNMDVKFPFNNYMNYLNEESPAAKENYRLLFLKDVRQRVKEATSRDYINPEEHTVDYVLVFIPNEQVYNFINENDPAIIDDSIKSKVILASPFTLYAVLSLIRQSVENFNIERTADEILALLGSFYKQWGEFKKCMDSMGKKIQAAGEEFQSLSNTRSNQLEKPLKKIEELRTQRNISPELIQAGEDNTTSDGQCGEASKS
jgi:DNA recombination protein RmuC